MKLNEEVLNEQIYILKEFLCHYASFREIHKNFDELCKFGSQEFWVFTINSHYFQAINLWCMVFGTDRNEVHWKNLGIGLNFTEKLISKLELSHEDYTLYWKQVIEWRNKYSAHRIPGFLKETPDLKLARSVVLFYEEWIEENSDLIMTSLLETYENDFKAELDKTMDMLINNN